MRDRIIFDNLQCNLRRHRTLVSWNAITNIQSNSVRPFWLRGAHKSIPTIAGKKNNSKSNKKLELHHFVGAYTNNKKLEINLNSMLMCLNGEYDISVSDTKALFRSHARTIRVNTGNSFESSWRKMADR